MNSIDLRDTTPADHRIPQDVEAERSVLGALLLSPTAIGEVIEELTPDHFYVPAHASVYATVADLYAQGSPVDVITVADELGKNGDLARIGGANYLHTLIAATPATASVGYYTKIVVAKSALRRLAAVGTRICQWAYTGTGEPADLIDNAQEEVYALTNEKTKSGYATARELLGPALTEIDQIQRGTTETTIPTGFADLDKIINGFHAGQLITIAGRPGSGKSTFGIDLARHAAFNLNLSTAVFSLEMLSNEIMMRVLSAESGVPLHAIRSPGSAGLTDQHWHRLSTAMPRIDTETLIIDESPNITPATIRAKSRRLKQKHGLRLIIVDYLQLMGGVRRAETRQQEVSELSRALKTLAIELEIPVIAISQLNRNPEQRVDKKPQLSDLRESGAIEQDSDMVIMVYREDMYTPETRPGEADLIVAKHRNGPLGTCTLAFQGHYSRFANMAAFND